MNIRLNLAIVVVAASLASCYVPPPRPIRPPTGVSLDRPASGDRSARESRYLEEQVHPMPPGDGPLSTTPPIDPNAPLVTTDAAAVQAPGGTPPPTTTTTTTTTVAPAPQPPTTANPSAPAATELPYGVPVPGKKGFVYSPYDKSAGFVDVRDIGPSTKVRCPYTGKIFRVP